MSRNYFGYEKERCLKIQPKFFVYTVCDQMHHKQQLVYQCNELAAGLYNYLARATKNTRSAGKSQLANEIPENTIGNFTGNTK